MRTGHHGFLAGHVDIHHALVHGAFVSGQAHGHAGTAVLGAVLAGELVHGEQAHLAAGFDGHVGHGQTAFHRQGIDDGTTEFQGLVQGTVHADGLDEQQHQVLAAQPLGHLAVDVHADGRGHLDPGLAQGHAGGDVGGAHARGEGADAAVGAGVAVRADDHVTGAHQAAFGQQGVFHAAVAAFVIVGDALLLGELAADHHLVGRGDVLLGREVVHDQGDLVLVEHAAGAHALEGFDGQGAGDVIGQHQGQAALDDLSVALDEVVGVGLQDLLRKRLRHDGSP